MNKGDLVTQIASEAGLSKAQAGATLNSVLDAVTGSLKKATKLLW